MPHKTNIEWADYSSNALRARDANGKVGWSCAMTSPGCAACYSSALNGRFGTGLPYNDASVKAVEHFIDEKELKHILTFRPKGPFKNGQSRPKVFPFDMTDLFGEWVPFETIDRMFAAFALRPDVDFMVLTKRAERMAEYLNDLWPDIMASDPKRVVSQEVKAAIREWPLPNVWLGVSCEDQKRADERIPHLLRCPAAVRFLSVEPMLGPVDLKGHFVACPHCLSGMKDITGDGGYDFFGMYEGGTCDRCDGEGRAIHQVIVGGESGPGARPLHPDWARSIRDQCQAAGVSFFFKQWGAWVPSAAKPIRGNHTGGGIFLKRDGCYGDQGAWWDGNAEALDKVGKKQAGRLLDGREWNEMPEVSNA